MRFTGYLVNLLELQNCCENKFSHFLQIGLYDVQKHDISCNVTTTLNVKFDEASKKPEQNKY